MARTIMRNVPFGSRLMHGGVEEVIYAGRVDVQNVPEVAA